MNAERNYRVPQVSLDLRWVDFDFCVLPSCPAEQPLLPNSHQPKQIRADSGTHEIQVNKTQSQLTWDTLYVTEVLEHKASVSSSPPPISEMVRPPLPGRVKNNSSS